VLANERRRCTTLCHTVIELTRTKIACESTRGLRSGTTDGVVQGATHTSRWVHAEEMKKSVIVCPGTPAGEKLAITSNCSLRKCRHWSSGSRAASDHRKTRGVGMHTYLVSPDGQTSTTLD